MFRRKLRKPTMASKMRNMRKPVLANEESESFRPGVIKFEQAVKQINDAATTIEATFGSVCGEIATDILDNILSDLSEEEIKELFEENYDLPDEINGRDVYDLIREELDESKYIMYNNYSDAIFFTYKNDIDLSGEYDGDATLGILEFMTDYVYNKLENAWSVRYGDYVD